MNDGRYDLANIARLVVDSESTDDEMTLVFLCVVSGRETAVQWPLSPGVSVEQSIFDAFRSVEKEFFWDGRRWIGWDANDLVVTFQGLLERDELTGFENRVLLARALHEVLCTDGVLAPEEEKMFRQFCPEFTEMPAFDPLRDEDYRGLSRRGRDALYAFCCAMAMCDFDLHDSEELLLSGLADSLGLSSLGAWELNEAARHYLIDRLLDKTSYAEAVELGQALGLDQLTIHRLRERQARRKEHAGQAEPTGKSGLTAVLDDWMLLNG